MPPEPVTEFQTARLFLSQFGYLNIGGDKKGMMPRLVALDSSSEGFERALRRIDACGSRSCVTVHVFCARAGQRRAATIAANTRRLRNLPPAFLRMLSGLGSAVRVRGHPGWTGHVDTSYDAFADYSAPPASMAPAPPVASSTTDQDGSCPYDGKDQILYWSDSTTEVAFVVPSESENVEESVDSMRSEVDGSCLARRDRPAGSCWDVSSESSGAPSYERSISESDRGERTKLTDKVRALSLELDKQTSTLTGSGRRNREYTTKILIVWLEDFEDHLNLPLDELLCYCDTGVAWRRHEVATLCVSAVRGGLARVQCVGAAPLADGALVAPALLPDLLRRAAIDIDRRRRLHTDLHQPPHVRRRHLIQELAQQFRRNLSEPELLESLFRPPL
ncbi:Ral GTPase-activating protein subunit beta [Eumeta japonica]|uniref:Ral GTPase-activating protein subunit beta n=1 Tax=Eumeta variegata TaxID=151549 RepID=A0A4C1X726_EUMVA|nr:Ral GTPase-activating protein subunit beta [Eumeta japonica]